MTMAWTWRSHCADIKNILAVRNATGYDMIRSFTHKGLEKFHETGSLAGIQAIHAKRLRLILAMLGQARVLEDMNAPGLRLHPLQGNLKNFWSLTVQANWRIIFRFEDGDVHVVDYVDYH